MFSEQADFDLLNCQEKMFTNHLTYWHQQLTGARPLPELSTDSTRSSQIIGSVGDFSFLLPKLLSDELRNLSQRSDTNIGTALLACFNILLFRYTNEDDIIIAFSNNQVISNINESGVLMSADINKMLVRTDLSGDPGFTELLKRLRKTVIDAEMHQILPFDSLVQSLAAGALNIDPYFRIVFEFRAEGISAECFDTAKSDLHLLIEEKSEKLSAQWKYNSGLFNEGTIKRITDHFQNLLFGLVTSPDKPISKLPLLNTPERIQILYEWNNTFTDYPDEKCIHELFEDQVKRTPGSIAVEIYEEEGVNLPSVQTKLTFHQINSKANQLAHHLREFGVGPDVLVGICVKRSVEMVVGLLGILKAGGAYVPLDPGYPKERLAFMLNDSGVSVLLTHHQLLKELPPHSAQTVCLDTEWATISQYSNKNLVSDVQSANLAYVIYTSGSTGTPKGTLIIHRGVVNYLSWCIKEYAVAEGTGAPVNSSIAFDATVTSFFAPLLSGKRVVLLPEKEEIEALNTVLLSANHFSLVKITPAHLEILRNLQEGHEIDQQSNAFIIGGEALLANSVEFWRTHAPHTRLINEYGPTETVVGCCTYEISNTNLLSEEVPIGRPIANTQMYILDRHMEPQPIGVGGEIYIGGAGLARGYLNRPDLTEQRFVPNPFSDDPTARLYKTGDLGRYLDDGNIVFLGRVDHQVKIRGYRIELGEIESTLAKHSLIQQVSVIAREDNPGNKRLVAYLVPKEKTPSIHELRLFLSEKLPEYMVPGFFVFLKDLPLTSNGKVDRAALPVPELHHPELEKSYVAPRNETEIILAKIFKKCLNLSSIGVQDDFFELGGSSVQAAIAFSQIRKTLGKPLPLSTLIHAPTIEKIAIHLNEPADTNQSSSLVAIQPKGSKPPLFCIHGGLGNVLFYRHLSKQLGEDQPVYGIQAKGLNGSDTPYEKMEEMAAFYIREICIVQPNGPYHLTGYCFGAIVAFEMAQQLHRAGQKIALLGSFNGVAPTQSYSLMGILKNMFLVSSTKQKLLYPIKMLKVILRWYALLIYYAISHKIRAVAYKFYLSKGRKMPDSLGRHYVVDAIGRAQNAYIPQPYPGQLIIFRSPGIFKNPHLRWTNLIAGGIKTHDMPGNYKNRKYIMFEPYVQSLAEELKNYLEQHNMK